ncbi:MAG TPA: K(+)-transporting ATPase subunit C [Tepidisphaeraceae bacterium]|jgi:K+-transporting ATPase ATPase C chain
MSATEETRDDSIVQDVWRSVAATAILLVLCCGIYPLIVWAIAQAAFPAQANGSLVRRDGTFTTRDDEAAGSALLGQNFSAPQYFHPRPSAAGDGYDAASSGGSNLGPLSEKLIATVKDRIAAYRRENDLPQSAPIPGDAVTASGSGLDPHISPANAELQTARVARARGCSDDGVRQLVRDHTDHPSLRILGDPGVNVLMLNLALDAKYPTPTTKAAAK